MGPAGYAHRRQRRRAITLEDRDLIRGAAAWAAKTELSALDTGLPRSEARRQAEELIRALRAADAATATSPPTDADIDVLRAACELLTERFARGSPQTSADSEQTGLLADAERLFQFASGVVWPEPDFGERAEVLADCAIAGWRIARHQATPGTIEEWQARLFAIAPKPSLHHRDSASGNQPAIEITSQSKTDPILYMISERLGRETELHLCNPEAFLPVLEDLRHRWEAAPAEVLREAEYLYTFLDHLETKYPADAFLLDEREYFLGEAARIAGTMCRVLAHRDEARLWFDRSEGWFLLTENSSGNLARLSYQRLALRFEEREFAGVFELLPQLIAGFEKLGMAEDALKTRFLHAAVLKETERLPEAKVVFDQIANEAFVLRNEQLQAQAYVNLVQIYGFLGDAEQVLAKTNEATEVLRRLGNHTALAKLQWGLATLFRARSDHRAAIEAYRVAQREFMEIGMRADVAAVHLVVADMLLDAGQEKQAEWEIRQALPLIDEYKLVPEGLAAMTLLRESLRRQKIDRQALRNLHEHFEHKKA